MRRKIGLLLLGVLLAACLAPVFSFALLVPVALVFGDDGILYQMVVVLTFFLSATTAAGLIYQIWTPRPLSKPDLASKESNP